MATRPLKAGQTVAKRRARRASARAKDHRRGSPSERGYTHAWHVARTAFLHRHPVCTQCERDGRTTAATVVDHVIPHKGDKLLFWDRNNWQSLCKACHDRKTGLGA